MARWSHLAFLAVAVTLLQAASAAHWLNKNFFTDGNVQAYYEAGQQVAKVSLDQRSGGGFNSYNQYLFGEFTVQMKLIPGNSAGTVASFYLTSDQEGDDHDEIDMEFMGNSSGCPVVLNTNVWAHGDGKKEHQFYLWFDPAADYHTYTIIWNPENIIFKVDGNVIRCFKRYADLPYPNSRPMKVHATLWDGSYWATQKGKVPIDWSRAPFVVSYRGYYANACVSRSGGGSACPSTAGRWMHRQPSNAEWGTIRWAERDYMHYNYCQDGWRFPNGLPAECSRH
ncbi:hypothetical protein ACP70R_003248 [Stipagrostis hirtigluma subsp. patula]